ncbi:UNVERIFIED_ORG: ATP-binding protein [Bacillus sp. AZ43]
MIGRHLKGLTEAVDVRTLAFNRATLMLRHTAADNDMAALLGEPGTGKTFCALAFLEEVTAAGRLGIFLQSDVTATHTLMTTRLLQKLTGGRPTGEGYHLTDDLAELLDERSPVIVVDEAHRAQARGLDQLVYLKETAPEWTLVLIGSELPDSIGRVPGVRSRLRGRTAAFGPLTGPELLQTLRAWHPLLRDADPELLQRIDARYCHGKFRAWAQLVRGAQKANQELHARGKPTHPTLTTRLLGPAVGIAGFDAWEVPA